MDVPYSIKPYPKCFSCLPISDKGFTTLMTKTIYLNRDIIADLKTADPKPLSVAVLLHQEIHARDASIFKITVLMDDFV